MGDQPPVLEQRRFNPVKEGLSQTGLYHSFQLPNGTYLEGAMPLEYQLQRLASFGLPLNLNGKRALDIGPWDGFFTFELEKRGADLTAIDYVDLDTFRALHRAFRSTARYFQMDVYELDRRAIGVFDIVLCLGVMYHLKYPLLALEKICAVTTDVCIIETFVTDGDEWSQGTAKPIPSIEFYERDELGGQMDNWCGPTVSAVEALARSAGFARTEVLRAGGNYAIIAAHRLWASLPSDGAPAPTIVALTSNVHRGRSFHTKKEEYIHLWCAWDSDNAPRLNDVFPEIDGYGIPPLSCTLTADGLQVGMRLPPGLESGTHYARIRIGRSGCSDAWHFYVDLPDLPENAIQLLAVQDGVNWRAGEIDWQNGGWVTAWISGLSEEADAGNTTIEVSSIPHRPDALNVSQGQVNFRLRPLIGSGEHEVRVLHRGAVSPALRVNVTGNPPVIRGLEQLQ
jgi:tRNA (mo5U34)-methyltransferase